MCHTRGIVLVSDEVYRGIAVDPSSTLPDAADVTPSAASIYASALAAVPSDRIRIGFGRTGLAATLDVLRTHLDGRSD